MITSEAGPARSERGAVDPPGLPIPLAPNLVDESVRLWGEYRNGLVSYDEHDRALVELELAHGIRVTRCSTCLVRHGTIIENHTLLCATCRNAGRYEA